MESEFHLGEYFAILKRRYIYLILPFLVVLGGSIAVAVLMPPVYQSSGTILIESPQIPDEMIRSTVTSLASERIEIIKQRVMTRANLFRIAEKFDIFKDDSEVDSTTKAVAKMPSAPKATFVLGFAAEEILGKELAEILPKAIILGGVDNMDELLWRTDLAIVSAGYLKMEAAITATPAILVASQWHQLPLAEEFVKRTGAPYAGYMGFMTSDDIAQAAIALESASARSDLAERTAKVVDGQGFERVYRAIFSEAV